jgi:hypothetical protein
MYAKELWKQKRWVVVAILVTIFFVLPLVPIVTSREGRMRFEGTSIFSPAEPIELTETKEFYKRARGVDNEQGFGIYGTLFHNQYVLFGLLMLKNYLSHFNPNFFMFTSDYPRHHMPQMGLIYFIELPLLVSGFYYLAKNQLLRSKVVAFTWILLAPIPASVTRDVPHALRSEIMLPMIPLMVAFGVVFLYQKLREKPLVRKVFLVSIVAGYWLFSSFFLQKFLYHYARETSEFWQYGRKEAVLFADSIKQNYNRVIVSVELEQPHVFFLYYTKYDPKKYLSEGGTVSGGWAEDHNHFDKYDFKFINYDEMNDGTTLFVGRPKDFPGHVNVLKKIQYLNGKDAIWIVEG